MKRFTSTPTPQRSTLRTERKRFGAKSETTKTGARTIPQTYSRSFYAAHPFYLEIAELYIRGMVRQGAQRRSALAHAIPI